MSTVVINATAASLLGFLESSPRTGWELMTEIEQSIGNFWNVTRSQVYRELNSLAADGLVEAGDLGPRDRQPYRITDQGREAFREWINREPGDELIRFPLLLTVFFKGRLAPERLARFLTIHRLRHEQCLEEFEVLAERLRGVEGGPVDALRFGVAYERAVIEWIGSLLAASEAEAGSERSA
jgi:DNA-binding PadR family transcriptional regulator